MRDSWLVVGVIATIAALVGGAYWLSGAKEREGWRLCEDAIKATLKAPSTYRRVEDRPDSFPIGDKMFHITYEAQNSFGVPIRSHGSCTINADRSGAEWVRYPDSI
jgi:hypothetical protein